MARKKKTFTEEALLIAYNIREARAKKFDTINAAATSLKVEKTLWRQWESALVMPQKSMLQKAADHLGVTVPDFYKKPDGWETIKVEFIIELMGRTKVKKEYYQPVYQAFQDAARISREDELASAAGKQGGTEDRQGNTELLTIFLQITKLITDARNKAHEIDQETYDTHMQTIADMAKFSLLVHR